MKKLLCNILLLVIVGCASTSPVLTHYNLEDNEKRLIKINPVQNKTGNPEYDTLAATLTGKFINYVKKSGKYQIIDTASKSNSEYLKTADSMAIVNITKITFNDNILFGFIAWINSPTVEVDMTLYITDIDTSEILSTSSVTQKAWEEEWVAFFVFKIGSKKTKKQLEPIALDYAIKTLVDKM